MSLKLNLYLTVLLLFLTCLTSNTIARQATDEQEVYLTFQHQNAVNTFVTAIYRNDEFFLPQTELFRVLQISQTVDIPSSSVSGQFPGAGPYRIDYQSAIIVFNGNEFVFSADDLLIRELDFYITPSVLETIFGLDFTVNFNNLSLSLESDQQMPVVAQYLRARQRERNLRAVEITEQSFYPLRYDRNFHLVNGGFLDYNLSANFSESVNNYLLGSSIGLEVAGGDFQGNIFGSLSRTNQILRSQNLRWQYGIRDSDWLTRITAGQTATRGLRPTSITGIQITNEPIEPRYLYDDYVISGSTVPNSDIELLRNNLLVSYQRVDEAGNYRFTVPLTYGTTRYNLRTYAPDGDVIDHLTRIQIPYTFNPPGEINYSLSAGRLDNPIPGTADRGYMARAGALVGLTNWLSATGGVEYFDSFHDNLPTFTAGLSSRLFTNYLISVEAASQAYYRINGSVYYGDGTNLNVDYTLYNSEGGLYNFAQSQSAFRATFFTPFKIGNLPIFFRSSVSHDDQSSSNLTRYRFELNSILGRVNLRLGYQDSQAGKISFRSSPASKITATTRYNFSRRENIPEILRGILIRGQISYAPVLTRFIDMEVQTSRSFMGDGRIQFAYGQNFLSNTGYFRVNMSFDFNSVRVNSSARNSRGMFNMTQSIRGSLGLDPQNRMLNTSNRQQVGRAGLAVRMFVDQNENGLYEDGEELISQEAIRVERSGGLINNNRGINYVTQLQPYRRYNLTVNKTALLNPLLVPSVERFSFVTDPNQYKLIDIPLYYSGIIEGVVLRRIGETENPQSGIRLFLTQTDHEEGEEPYSEVLTTFSDGSFYAWEIPPGTYQMEIDPVQLEFLGAETEPETLQITVRALAEGDFVTGLRLVIVSRDS